MIEFYELVAQRQFERAAELWTSRMQQANPPPVYIKDRFSQTRRLDLEEAEVVSLDLAAGEAIVSVRLVEVTGRPAKTRHYTGTWRLVRDRSGWLLDRPNLRD